MDSWFVFEQRETKENLLYLWGSVSHLSSLSNIQHMFFSIELFKLMKPSMFGRERHEMLLNNGVGDGRNLPALSTVNKGIKIQLHIINK